MSCYDSMPRRRLMRNRDRAVVAGVCAGLADHFGFNRKVTRILAVISLLMAPVVTLIVYFATVLLVPVAPPEALGRACERETRRDERPPPRQTLREVKRRFQSLDERMARLERYVTSSRYDLDREIRNL